MQDKLVERGVEPDECYVVGLRETLMPDLGLLLRFVDAPNQTAAVRAYRKLLREAEG